MEVVVEQRVHKQQQALQLQQQALQIQQQQLEDAMMHGLVMDIVMISITTWTAAMMAETVVDVTSKQHIVQFADA